MAGRTTSRTLKAVIFDFDGVLAESFSVKTRAFQRIFQKEHPRHRKAIVTYHEKNGGVSRYRKFRHIYKSILKRPLSEREFKHLCDTFSAYVVEEVIRSPWVKGAKPFLKDGKKHYALFIVTGTPHPEMHHILKKRKMKHYFKDVFGSPRDKATLLKVLLKKHRYHPSEVVYIGDAEGDWTAARENTIAFLWRALTSRSRPPHGYRGPKLRTLKSLHRHLAHL